MPSDLHAHGNNASLSYPSDSMVETYPSGSMVETTGGGGAGEPTMLNRTLSQNINSADSMLVPQDTISANSAPTGNATAGWLGASITSDQLLKLPIKPHASLDDSTQNSNHRVLLFLVSDLKQGTAVLSGDAHVPEHVKAEYETETYKRRLRQNLDKFQMQLPYPFHGFQDSAGSHKSSSALEYIDFSAADPLEFSVSPSQSPNAGSGNDEKRAQLQKVYAGLLEDLDNSIELVGCKLSVCRTPLSVLTAHTLEYTGISPVPAEEFRLAMLGNLLHPKTTVRSDTEQVLPRPSVVAICEPGAGKSEGLKMCTHENIKNNIRSSGLLTVNNLASLTRPVFLGELESCSGIGHIFTDGFFQSPLERPLNLRLHEGDGIVTKNYNMPTVIDGPTQYMVATAVQPAVADDVLNILSGDGLYERRIAPSFSKPCLAVPMKNRLNVKIIRSMWQDHIEWGCRVQGHATKSCEMSMDASASELYTCVADVFLILSNSDRLPAAARSMLKDSPRRLLQYSAVKLYEAVGACAVTCMEADLRQGLPFDGRADAPLKCYCGRNAVLRPIKKVRPGQPPVSEADRMAPAYQCGGDPKSPCDMLVPQRTAKQYGLKKCILASNEERLTRADVIGRHTITVMDVACAANHFFRHFQTLDLLCFRAKHTNGNMPSLGAIYSGKPDLIDIQLVLRNTAGKF